MGAKRAKEELGVEEGATWEGQRSTVPLKSSREITISGLMKSMGKLVRT